MKKVSIIVISIIVFVGAIGIGGFYYLKSLPVQAIDIANADISALKDGTYQGNYNTDLVKATVSVQVKDGRIENIDIIKHACGLGKSAEKITTDVINAQSLDVDAVSSATLSSRVILKAIETALAKGK